MIFGGMCNSYGYYDKCVQNLSHKTWRETYLLNQGVDGKSILVLFFEEPVQHKNSIISGILAEVRTGSLYNHYYCTILFHVVTDTMTYGETFG